jgi:hypothetical protein
LSEGSASSEGESDIFAIVKRKVVISKVSVDEELDIFEQRSMNRA